MSIIVVKDLGMRLVCKGRPKRHYWQVQCICGTTWETTHKKIKTCRSCANKRVTVNYTAQYYDKALEEAFSGSISKIEAIVNAKTKILHVHTTCGYKWAVTPNSLLQLKVGCPKCGDASAALANSKSDNEYTCELKETQIRHLEPYINAATKILHTHLLCGHEWKATPSSVLKRTACVMCARYGFRKDKPATLYYLEVTCNGVTAYKIGITNRTVADRYSVTELKKIIVLWERHYINGGDCHNEEQRIIQLNKSIRYKGKPLLSSGNTELFSSHIKI